MAKRSSSSGDGEPRVSRTTSAQDMIAADEEMTEARRLRWPEDPRLKKAPPEYEGTRRSAESFKHKYAVLAATAHAVSMGWEEMPRGFNLSQALDVLNSEAKYNGFDPKHLMDARSEGDKMRDAVDRLMSSPEAMFEVPDNELDLLEQEFQKAVDGCDELIQQRREEKGHSTLEAELERERRRYAKGKEWLNRVRRVRRLREWVRTNRHPKDQSLRKMAAFEAAKPLLYMLYVTRSSMDNALRGGKYSQLKIHLIGPPHVRMATDLWQARKGITYHAVDGIVRGEAFDGALMQAPPGHGKTSFVMAVAGLEASTNPMMQGIYIHFKEDVARENLAFISRMFDLDNPMGRRRDALFPGRVKTDYDNNAYSLRLASKNPTKSPTLVAAGVNTAALSVDSNIQFWDDIIPKSDRDQPTERERRMETMAQGWKTRIRGKGFILFTGYPFHKGDVLSKHVDMIVSGKIRWVLSRQAVGGPSTTPAFKSIWKEVYPENRLRQIFEEMNRDHAGWAANFMLNPIADESRLVRKVRLYDPNDEDGQHAEFMQSAQFHISVDPTATNREKSDHAGVLYLALGEVRTKRGDEYFYQRRLRLLEASRLHVNQVELTHHIANYVLQRPVYQVHIEVRSSSGSATCDLLQEQYGLEVVRHDPTNIKKGVRLKACAGVIDNSSTQFPAIVEFPGVWNEQGELVLDPRVEVPAKQLIDFGVADADEYVDAFTQIINYLLRTGELVAGEGEASKTVRQAMQETGDPRILAMLKQYERGPVHQTAQEEDLDWFSAQNN